MNKVKVEFYDDFRCIADRCTFSCCRGWDITIDAETYGRWNSGWEDVKTYTNQVKADRRRNAATFFMKMGKDKTCPFLEASGLCNIVKHSGDTYLPKTCRVFPRLENHKGELSEYSLSCACPVVVDMINGLQDNIRFLDDDHGRAPNPGTEIREKMLSILHLQDYALQDRLLLIFHLLLSIRMKPESAKIILDRYGEELTLSSTAELWRGIELYGEDSLIEIQELFLDINQNYQSEKHYKVYLKGIMELAEECDPEKLRKQWDDFKLLFSRHDKLMENCLATKIFAGCVSEDQEEMILAFQMLVTEYVMVRYASFLIWLKEKVLVYNNIRDYITVYSRMIGYNTEGMKEFWEESFDEAVWDFGYLLMLLN